MNKEELMVLLDHRMMLLIELFYEASESYLLHDRAPEIRERMKEVLYIAEELELLTWEQYDKCLDIVLFIGQPISMEDRQW